MGTSMLIMEHHTDPLITPWPWPNFTAEEMSSNGNGALQLNIRAMNRLQELRTAVGRPFTINSAYRDPAYNKRIGGSKNSKHMLGQAFDISVRGWPAMTITQLVEKAYDIGFRGFGGYDRGGRPNFIHIDDRGSRARWGKTWAWPIAYQ